MKAGTVTALAIKVIKISGKHFTKEEAIQAYKQHLAGDGGNTVGEAFMPDRMRSRIEDGVQSESDVTAFGDALIDLGRVLDNDKKKQ